MTIEVNREILIFLMQKDEINMEYGNDFIFKVHLTENIFGIFSMSKNVETWNSSILHFLFNNENEEIIAVFKDLNYNSFFKTKISTIEINTLVNKFNESIKTEFSAVMERIDFDESLLKNQSVIEAAELNFSNTKDFTFEIPQFSLKELNFKNIAKILKDFSEAAFEYLENYLVKNPNFIIKYQKFLATKKLINEKVLNLKEENNDTLNDELNELNDLSSYIYNLLKNCSYSSVKLTYELADNTTFTESLKLKNLSSDKSIGIRSLPPIYTIKQIKWKNSILYDRNISNLEELKKDVNTNIEYLTNMQWNEKPNYIQPIQKFFDVSLFDNIDFAVKLLIKFCDLNLISNRLQESLEFVKKCIDTNNHFFKGEKLYNMFPKLKDNESYGLLLLSYNVEHYKQFSLELKRNKNILHYIITNNLFNEVFFLINDEVLNTTELFDYVCNYVTDYPNLILNLCFSKKITDKTLFLNMCKHFRQIPPHNLSILVDKTFVLDLLTSFDENSDLRTFYSQIKYFSFISKDIDLLNLIIIKSGRFIEHLLPKLPKTVQSITNINHLLSINESIKVNLLKYCDDNVKIELLKADITLLPYLLVKYDYFNSDSDKKSNMIIARELIKLDISYFSKISCDDICDFKKKNIIELLTINPDIFEYLEDSFKTLDVIDFLADKKFILPFISLMNWGIYNILADKSFILKQFVLEKNILKYIPKSDKRRNYISLQDDMEFVLKVVKEEPKNLEYLSDKSNFWTDIEFATEILSNNKLLVNLFPVKILKDENIKKIIS